MAGNREPWRIEEQYAYGDCDVLALAIHRRTGLPLRAVVIEDGRTYSHVWVSLPSGLALDIWGMRPEDGIRQAWTEDDDRSGVIMDVDADWLLAAMPDRQKVGLEGRMATALVDFDVIHGRTIEIGNPDWVSEAETAHCPSP